MPPIERLRSVGIGVLHAERCAVLVALLAMLAPALPSAISAPPPFPAIAAQSVPDPSFVAPGVARADYVLRTLDGPLVVHVVAVDPRDPTVRLGAVLAHDRLVSGGETVSSMAARTGAIAGINADYYDIGATNQPLNVLVRDGALLRTPSARAALWVGRDRSVGMGSIRFSGYVRWDAFDVPLAGVDLWPPDVGATLVTPAYGPRADAPGVVAVPLVPVDPALGTYRVANATSDASEESILALGPAALTNASPPPPGDTVLVAMQSDPPLSALATAVGGGPLLVRDGAPYDDPNSPSPSERDHRFPVAGAGLRSDGALLLVVVDGRRPEESIGLTRPQFGALLQGLGARDAMAFDSGGSATLVARVLGDAAASVLNVPSDGIERPVADGLFVYSDAPAGRPDRLALRPSRVRGLVGTRVAIDARIVDAAGHAYGKAGPVEGGGTLGRIREGVLSLARAPGAGEIPVRAGALRSALPVEVDSTVQTLRIVPSHANPDPGGTLALRALGADARGDAIVTTGEVRWSAYGGTIDSEGVYHAGLRNGVVLARAGGTTARLVVLVGRHRAPQSIFATPDAWHFASAPSGAAGDVAVDAGALQLDYDLTGTTRAAYARSTTPLPGEPVALDLDVRGDARGVALRAQFVNRYGEPVALTLAKHVDWNGWRTLHVAIPGEINPPMTLTALYVVPSLGGPPVRAAGSVQFRNLTLIEAGTP
ncbi:MAG TPA: phosphodiester glycosidase family protein [Candidatus Acidoferrum sp.]|nr:phosphodiester glycosidase family protein [Candidatus Acidoferrum sp.]